MVAFSDVHYAIIAPDNPLPDWEPKAIWTTVISF